MTHSLPPRLAEYLSLLQSDARFVGLEDFHRRHNGRVWHARTIYRWRRRYGHDLVTFPTFTIEALGLSHVHLFIVHPNHSWTAFPYAVEQAWTTNDLVNPVLYLHCIVPTIHLTDVAMLVKELQGRGWCRNHLWLASGSGWQQLNLQRPGHERTPLPLPSYARAPTLLKELPLVVPAIFEAWGSHASLPRFWRRIHERLGTNLRSYLPGRRVHLVNGKSHVREAYTLLETAGLFRQHVVRGNLLFAGSVDLFLLLRSSPDQVTELLEGCRRSTRTAETYLGAGGRYLLHLAGSSDILDAISNAELRGQARAFFVKHVNAETVRFRYELLFDPKTGTWVFPRERIMELLSST